MKKVSKIGMYISGAFAIVGVVLSANVFWGDSHENKAITIIGGADGPTSIYLAGSISRWDTSTFLYCLTGFFVLLTLLLMVVNRKRKK